LKISIRNEFFPVYVLLLALILAVLFLPSSSLRVFLALPVLLFLSGYSLISAVFPRREGLDALERVTLGFGFSIVVVSLLGLLANFTPWGIRLEPLLYLLVAFVVVASWVSWFRRKRLPEHDRFRIHVEVNLPGWGPGTLDRALSVVLVVTLLGTLGVVGYAIATPKASESFTEFYILGEGGQTTDYPTEVRVGEPASVTAVIVNHEGRAETYRIEIRVAGARYDVKGPIAIAHEARWEGQISFQVDEAGNSAKVEFHLYGGEPSAPVLDPLYLWVTAVE